MYISEIIADIKNCCRGTWNGMTISEESTRDKILYGDPEKECTGIVTTIYASIDVIRQAHELGANFIIAHEALFWNHGDHQEWLQESGNRTYLAKKQLLDEYGICVWRFHDYIHSGIPCKDGYIDGIFYGLAQESGWQNAMICDDLSGAVYVECQARKARDIAQEIRRLWHLSNMKCLGNLDATVTKILVCGHVMEGGDANRLIERVDREDINLLIPLELIDFTLSEYIKDAGQLGYDKAIIAPGHFNVEEPGMRYMIRWLPDLIDHKVPVNFVQAGDMYTYL